ncbi:unnamed protein product [Notodromas monacha]|uniref:Phosphodiesterase n=1 Tax=Notodromas monacha TaxID=399045 RepID=A0A7R9BBR6_9CRUS|nr:unnamed protein product [Notodromas monacha]CAG0912330.1 unnamed protein product [Notodromas monacha]
MKAAEEEEDDEFSEVEPDAVPPEVRAWLTSTFTRGPSGARKAGGDDISGKPKFRSVANAIRAGIFVERICRRPSASAFLNYPPSVTRQLKRIDDWDFDVFGLNVASDGSPLKYLGYELFTRYGILNKYKISSGTLIAFLNGMEAGYAKYNNPYHNSSHAADVTQTVHYLLFQCGLMNWLSDLEIFGTLLAAMIHDFEHTGTTNNFHVMSNSGVALLYNDRAVLENHHISAAFRLCHDGENSNIFKNMTREEYRELRALVIEMVLATDMSFHFQQVKQMRSTISLPDSRVEKAKVLSLALHSCDISHPSKPWNLHHIWTLRLMEEFFRQGDLENDLGLPYSPLCDRNTTHVADAQLSFIDFIVEPTMNLLGDVLTKILTPSNPDGATESAALSSPSSTSLTSGASHQVIPEAIEVTSVPETERKQKESQVKEATSEDTPGKNRKETKGVASQRSNVGGYARKVRQVYYRNLMENEPALCKSFGRAAGFSQMCQLLTSP